MYGLTDGPTQIIEMFSFEKYNLAIIDDIKLTYGSWQLPRNTSQDKKRKYLESHRRPERTDISLYWLCLYL